MPKVSVILTSYNHEKYIREAIESVLSQTFADFELIIWDDASSDNSWSIIQSYDDARIRAFRNPQRLMGGNLNRALELALGEYIAIHHSDDVWEPDKLEKQIPILDANHEIGAVFSRASIITDDGLPLTDERNFYYNVFNQPNRTRHEWLNFFFKSGNVLCHPSVLIRRACYTNCGLYHRALPQLGDFDMWVRLCLKYEIHVLPEKLVRFRVRANEANTSGDRPETRTRAYFEYFKILQNYRKLTTYEELAGVFPSAAKYFRNTETDVEFSLAMIALEEKPFGFTQLFGLDILFNIISNPVRATSVRQLYNFEQKNYIELSGRQDIFSREEVAALSRSLTERDGRIASLVEVVNDRDAYNAHLSLALAERDKRLDEFNQVLVERDAHISHLEKVLAERDAHISHLEKVLAELEGIIRTIKKSLSWKVASPLRILNKLLRGKLGDK